MKKYYYFALMLSALMFACTEQKPLTIYMVGDSTMADRYDTIETPERGWGQVFPTYLNEKVIVKNHAKNGRSTKSYLAEGRWEKVMETLGRGDVVIIQFGHNDAKESDSTRFCPPDKYAENLLFMIRQAKAVGALPILCTPIARRHYKNNELQYVHGDYPVAMKGVAERENVPLVDMTTLTMEWLAPLGDEGSQPYFVYIMKPGEFSKYPDGKTDNTHLRLAGALKVAQLFAQAVKEDKVSPLNKYVEPNNTEIKYSVSCGIK
ncbi:MAG: rhamnogalacturonan acetylesterase [Paludibacteraceae bacterium]|nr:rhamnogalacturonan acetylesterase [Paludibacteraceae bacterium]